MEELKQIKSIKVGDVVKGIVMKVTENEVLVDLNYITEGTIYKEYLSLDKINSCHDVCKVGDELEVKVTKIVNSNEGINIYLSRIDLERQDVILKHRQELAVDQNVEAKVKKVIDQGLVLDYHGTELFCPASLVDLNPIDMKTLANKKVIVKILDIQEERNRLKIVCSRKQVQYETLKRQEKEKRDERKANEQKELSTIKVGDILQGTITKLFDFGVVVRLGDFTEGLLHISEMSHYHIKDVKEVVALEQQLTVQVVKIQDKKISLSLKTMQKTPWQIFMETHQVGETVKATIVKKMQNGMLLEVDREVSGLLSKQDYAWNVNDNFAGRVQVGEKVEVKITSIDPIKKQFTLSKKHLEYNPWADIKYKEGEHISATIKSIQDKGAIIEVQGVEGYLPIQELSDDRIEKVESIVKVGEVHTLEVLECIPNEWRLKVSLKRVLQKESQKEYEAIKKENVSGNQSLADLFGKFKK